MSIQQGITVEPRPDTEDLISAANVEDARKVSVLLVGKSPHLFSFIQPSLERVGCQCYFAESHREIGDLLRHTKLDIVLSLNSHQSLFELIVLLAGLRVSVFYMLPVEEGCWWLPVIRNGEKCLGTPALGSNEFSYVLVEIIKGIIADAKPTSAT
jgi:hypothetical protein